MKLVSIVNRTRRRVLGTRIGLADRWWLRLRGLLGRAPITPGEGLLLVPCRSVHTFGMGYPIDVAFLDATGTVVALYPALEPGRISRTHRTATQALELPSGTFASSGTEVGDALLLEPKGVLGTGDRLG